MQTQLARATRALQDLHRNMPYRLLRLAPPLLLAGSRGMVLPGDTRLLEQAAGAAADPAAALAYLHAADRVIQVDDFE